MTDAKPPLVLIVEDEPLVRRYLGTRDASEQIAADLVTVAEALPQP